MKINIISIIMLLFVLIGCGSDNKGDKPVVNPEPPVVPSCDISKSKNIVEPILNIVEKRYGHTIPTNHKNTLIDMNCDGRIYSDENKTKAEAINNSIVSIVNELYDNLDSSYYGVRIDILDGIYSGFNLNDSEKYHNALLKMRNMIANDINNHKFECNINVELTANYARVSCLKLPISMYMYTVDGVNYSTLPSDIITLPLQNIPIGKVGIKIDDDVSEYLNGFNDEFFNNQELMLLDINDKTWVSNDGNHKILIGNASGFGLDIVILGDGYLNNQKELFDNHVNSMIDALMRYDNIKMHKELYNVHSIFKPSNEQGADWTKAINGSINYADSRRPEHKNNKDTYYDAGFYNRGSDDTARLLSVNSWKAIEAAKEYVPYYDQIIVLVNTSLHGGSGGEIAVASTNDKDVAIHELGHSFANLLDEYTYDDWILDGPIDIECEKNICYNFDKVSWYDWLPKDKNSEGTVCKEIDEANGCYKDTIGWYEGGAYFVNNRWRATDDSIMRNTGEPFYSVNAEIWLDKLYEISGAFLVEQPYKEPFNKKSRTIINNKTAITFKIKKIIPSSTIEWLVNGVTQNVISDTFEFSSDDDFSIEVIVTDNTKLTRNNKMSFKWNVLNDNEVKKRNRRSTIYNDLDDLNNKFVRLWLIDDGESLLVKDQIRLNQNRVSNVCDNNRGDYISYTTKENDKSISCPINNNLHVLDVEMINSNNNMYDITIPETDYIDIDISRENEKNIRSERIYIK
ncbi:MAG: M64 family metallopeptidase [Vibrio sp.]